MSKIFTNFQGMFSVFILCPIIANLSQFSAYVFAATLNLALYSLPSIAVQQEILDREKVAA